MPSISVIIPVLNEATIIEQALLQLKNSGEQEIIVVDGGSKDRTVEIAQKMNVSVIKTVKPGRGNQMNTGAEIAQGEILLFLHADTKLPNGYETLVQQTLKKTDTIAGAFELVIDSKSPSLRLVEIMVNLRSRLLSLPYGDQALFINKKVFQSLGGFAELPIMEDFEFVNRLKCRGKIRIAPAAVMTSSRRWQKLGVWKTTIINQLVILGYYLGVSPAKLKKFYRRVETLNKHKHQ